MATIKNKAGIILIDDPSVDLRTLITRCARAGIPIPDAFLHGEWLRDTDMSKLMAAGAVFDSTDLCYARLDHANLSNASFRNCYVAGVDFRGAALDGVDWSFTELEAAHPHPRFSPGKHPVADKNVAGLPGWFDEVIHKAAQGDQAARDQLKEMMLDPPKSVAVSPATMALLPSVLPSMPGAVAFQKTSPTAQPVLKLGRKAAKPDGEDDQ